MPEIDSLDIKISAEANNAVNSLNTLIDSLGKVSTKISALNSQKIKLDFSFSGGATKEINNLDKYVSKVAKNMSKNLQKAYDIPSSAMSGIRELTKEFAQLEAAGDEKSVEVLDRLGEEMAEIAPHFAKADEYAKEFYNTVMSLSKIYINPKDMGTDAWADMDGLLRQKFTNQASESIISLDSQMQELASKFPGMFDELDLSTVTTQLDALTRRVQEARNEIENPIEGTNPDFVAGILEDTVEEAGKAAVNIRDVKKALEEADAVTTTESTGFKELVNSLKALCELNLDNLNGAGNSLASVANGIKALEGVRLDGLAFEQLTSAVKQLGNLPKVNTANIAEIGTVLQTLSSSLTSIKSIGSIDKTITNLVNAVRKLASVDMANFNVNGLQEIVTSVTSLATIPDVSSGINKSVSALARLAGTGDSITIVAEQMPILKSSLNDIVASFASLGAVDSSILSFVSAITQLATAGAKIETVVVNLSSLGDALYDLILKLSQAPAVSKNVTQITSSLAKLSAQGSKVSSATNSISTGLSNFSTKAGKASTSAKSLATAFAKLYSVVFALRTVFNAISEAIDISSDLTEVQNVVDVAFADYKDVMEEFAETSITDYGMDELTAKTIGSRYQAMANAVGITTAAASEANDALSEVTEGYVEAGGSVADMSVNLTKLAADMASFYNLEAEDVAEDLESIYTGTVKPLRQYGLDLTEATLQEWALKNGIDADISSMSQAEKILLRYQYVLANTTDAQGDFARTSDTWANRTRVLKLQIQALGAVIGTVFINALKPALRALNSFMTSVTNVVQNIADALGSIFGWTIETNNTGTVMEDIEDTTTDATDAIADGYDDATEAAKEYENTVLDVDELHKLNDTNDSDSSSSSSSGSDDSDSVSSSGLSTSIKQTEGLISYYESEIENLYQLGEYIGTALTNALNSIDWASVYESARNFGTGLANFLNGLISPELFGTVGSTIASALNTAIYASLSFATTFVWSNFGKSVAAGVNNFFDTFDFAALADSIDAWAQGIFTAITTAISEIEWSDVWNGIKEFITNLDIDTIDIVIGAVAIKSILSLNIGSKVISWLGGQLGTYISERLPSISLSGVTIGGISVGSIIGTIASIAGAIAGVVLAVSNFIDMFNNGFSGLKEVLMILGIAIAAICTGLVIGFSPVIAIVAAVVAAVATGVILIKNNWEKVEAFFTGLADSFKEVKEKFESYCGEVAERFKTGIEGIKTTIIENIEKIKTGFKTAATFISEKFIGAYEKIKKAFSNIATWFGNKWTAVKNKLSDVKTWFSDKFTAAYNKVKESFSGIATWFGDKWTAVKEKLSGVKTWFSDTFIGAYSKVKSAFSGIATWFGDKWTAVKNKLSGIKSWFSNAFQNAYDAVTDIWDGLSNYFKKLMEKVFKPVKKLVNGVIKGINWVLDKIGSDTEIKEWEGITFAQGSSGVPEDMIGIVNDQKGPVYKELIVPPNGKPFVPEGRNVMLPLTKGTKIMPADETEKLLNTRHFATGIGDILGSAWAKVKDFTGDVWDYISNPKKLAQIAIDKFADVSELVSPWTSVASGMLNMLVGNIGSYISGLFETETPNISYDPSKGVEQWRALARLALKKCGQFTQENLELLLYQMKTESNGNPNAINNWDSNAKKGTPSKGLMQVIDPTFKAYAMSGYNTNIWDPLSNMIAAIRYTVARYGSLANGWKGHGYLAGIGSIKLSDIVRGYSTGGFVEDGLFMANQNELVGKFSNGKTAVANNDQITEGIAKAVQSAVYNAMMSANANQRGKNVELVVNLDGKEIGRTAVNYQNLQNKRYSISPGIV